MAMATIQEENRASIVEAREARSQFESEEGRKISGFGWRELIVVAALTGLAGVVRIYLSTLPYVVKGDESAYLWLGQSIARGNGFALMGMPELHYNPLFPVVIAAIYFVTGALEEASKIAFIIFGGLLVVPVYLMARRILGTLEAALAGVLAAVHPALTVYIFYEGGLSEPLYVFLAFSGLYALLLGLQESRWRAYAACGALFGLSYLDRSEGIELLVFGLAIVAVVAIIRRQVFDKTNWVALGTLTLSFAVFALPYVFYLYQHTGQLMISGKPWIAYVQNRSLAEGDLATFDKLTWGLDKSGRAVIYESPEKFDHSLVDEIVGNPRRSIGHLTQNVFRLETLVLDHKIAPIFLIALVALGLFGRAWNRSRLLGESVLVGSVILAVLPTLLMYPTIRFLALMFPAVFIWTAAGLVDLQTWLRRTTSTLLPTSRTERTRGSMPVVMAAIAGAVIIYFLAVYSASIKSHQTWLAEDLAGKGVALSLRSELPANAVMMSRDGNFAFYAGTKWAPFPNAEYDQVMAYARAHSVSYLVVDEWSVTVTRPQLSFLLDEKRAPKGLVPLRTEQTRAGKFVVYALWPPAVNSTPGLKDVDDRNYAEAWDRT
ncbi:MAG: glycosyltransferase family 39 protein [Dehalococcoidales bacterium]|nr:glycosyltransferase family 39 protein [Dehalococcoidales bacterium]